MTEVSGIPCPVCTQVNPAFSRLIQPTLSHFGIHPDIILDDDIALFQHPDSFWKELGTEYAALGVTPSVHLPHYGTNLGCRSSVIRKAVIQVLFRGIEVAGMLGAKYAVMHTGYLPMMPTRSAGLWLDAFCSGFQPLSDEALRKGVNILLENTWEKNPTIFDAIAKRCGGYDYCLDLGHCRVFSALSCSDWAEYFGNRIATIHLHDNNGLEDSHLALGKGIVDFSLLPGIIARQSTPPRLVIELKPQHIGHSLNYLSKVFAHNAVS